MNHAENGAVRPDAERERRDRDDTEADVLPELPAGVDDIVDEVVGPSSPER